MNNDLKILITAQLDENASKDTIQNQLNKIQNKLNLTIGIDTQQINQIASQVKQLQTQFEKQFKGIKIIDDQETLSNINQAKKGVREIYDSIDRAIERYRQFGQVKIEKSFDPVTRELNGFTLRLEKAQGLIEKIKFDLVQLKMPDGAKNGFLVVDRKVIDDTEKIREKQLQLEQKIDTQVQKQNEKIQQQLELYKKQAQVKVADLQRRYGDKVDNIAIKNYLSAVDSLNEKTPNLNHQMKLLDLQFKELSASIKESGSHAKSFGEQMSVAMQRIPIWFAGMTAFYAPLRLLQDAISQIITIDTQLTSLARVTDEQTDLNQVLEESIKLADQLGNKVVEINDGLIEFARQGFSGNDLLKITEFATLMANVSDLTVQEAASSLTAAIKGFSMEAEQAIHVVDALNEVDLNNKSPMSVMT
jgi:Phage-related minor tail protein